MRKQDEVPFTGNLTAMVDVVFQLIIFFVCTANLQDSAVNEEIQLPMAPHGRAVVDKDPREINIDVNSKGVIFIARSPLSQSELLGVLRATVSHQGKNIPIVIRADGETEHSAIKKVMDACTSADLAQLQFAALREKGR